MGGKTELKVLEKIYGFKLKGKAKKTEMKEKFSRIKKLSLEQNTCKIEKKTAEKGTVCQLL